MSNISVVSMTEEMIPEVLGMWLESFYFHHNIHPGFYRNIDQDLKLELKNFLTNTISDKNFGIFCLNDPNICKLAGFILYKLRQAPPLDEEQSPYGSILEIYVSPSFRRRGFGKILLNKVLGIFEDMKISRVQLQVSSNNPGAVALYQSLGFQISQYIMQKNNQ